MIVIFSEDEIYHVKLCDKTYNYYVVGNIINDYFLDYYMFKYYGFELLKRCEHSNKLYSIQLIDQNLKMRTMSNLESIILHEDIYVIK